MTIWWILLALTQWVVFALPNSTTSQHEVLTDLTIDEILVARVLGPNDVLPIRRHAQSLFQKTYFKRKIVWYGQHTRRNYTFFKADKYTFYMLESEHPRVSAYDYQEYEGLDLQTAKTLTLRHVKGEMGDYEETCYRIQGQLEHASFREYPLFGDSWIPIKYIQGRTLLEEIRHRHHSKWSPSLLHQRARNVLDRLHEQGYFHGNAYAENFIVEGRTGDVYMTNYQDCGPLHSSMAILQPLDVEFLPTFSSAKQDYTQLREQLPMYFIGEAYGI